jgi:O-antigen/teichoic acid export membrane protein
MNTPAFHKQFLKNSSILFVGSLLEKATAFAALPFLTRSFTQSEYGLLEILLASYFILRVLSSLNLVQAVARFAGQYTKSGSEATFFSTLFSITLINSVLLFSIAGLAVAYFPAVKIDLSLLIFWVLSNAIRDYLNGYLKFTGRTLRFVSEQLIYSLFFVVGIIYLARTEQLDIESFLILKTGLAMVSVFLNLLINYHKLLRPKFDSDIAKTSLSYSIPFVFSSLSLIAYQYIDRLMIAGIIDLAETGIYALAVKFSALYTLLSVATSGAIAPIIYKNHDHADAKPALRKIYLTYILTGLIYGVSIIFGIRLLFRFGFIGDDFLEAQGYLSLLVLLNTITSLQMFLPGLNIERRTWTILKINLVGLIVAILLNLLLIPRLGILGAIYASILSATLAQFIFSHVSEKHYSTGLPILRSILGVSAIYLTLNFLL